MIDLFILRKQMDVFIGIIVLVWLICCIQPFKVSKGIIYRMYGFVDAEEIAYNKEILDKELDLVNQGINGLSGVALTATGMIMGYMFIYKDKLLCEFSYIEIIVGSLILILFIYAFIYYIEMYIKTSHKKEIIKKLNNLQRK
jgi:hypothetical protein